LIRLDLTVFPWGDFPKGTRLCDVGGGKGHIALSILKASPHLHVTVQDLPNVISDAKEVGLSVITPHLSSPDPAESSGKLRGLKLFRIIRLTSQPLIS
jgi:hypothetical protein